MSKVYIVTSGEYSSYGINAVFSEKKLADEYIKRAGEGYGIEDYELDEPIPEARILVEMSKTGDVSKIVRSIDDQVGIVRFFRPNLLETDNHMLWCVRTDDKQKAIKIVNEKRFQILALDIWGDSQRVREMIK